MRIRSQTGAGTIGMILAISFGVILPIGILCFEFLRYSIAQQELRSVCDAAALSGAAAIATTAQKGLTYTDVQNQAMDSAAITFKQNSIYGYPLTNTVVNRNGDNPQSGKPPVGQTFLTFTLLDQNGTAVKTGDPAAKIVQIDALYGYSPALLPVFGIGPVVVNADSRGGLPQLDLVLCYDVSGSMDDQTKVTFVKRWYDPSTGYVKYSIAKGGSTGTANGEIYALQVPPSTGTRLNAIPPENLSTSNYTGSTGNKYPLYFRPDLRAKLVKSGTEIGAPPGNYDSSNPSNLSGNGVNPSVAPEDYTDVVVNLDEKDVFGGWKDTASGLEFKNIGMLVEAQRGNLESLTDFTTSQCGKTTNPVFAGITIPPTSGSYKTLYQKQAAAVVKPMAQAQQAASNFFNTMNVSANSHFALIAFSDGIGKPTPIWAKQPGATDAIIDPSYTAGGTANFPLPIVPLDSSNNNYTTVQNTLPTLISTGKTAIADSLNEALAELTATNTASTRPKATRAVVLFTDGEPNLPGGGGGATSPAANAAYTAASNAAKANIRIYCIGLSQNAAIKPTEDAILGKIASTTGGQYISVTNANDLNAAFQKIAKSLVVLK